MRKFWYISSRLVRQKISIWSPCAYRFIYKVTHINKPMSSGRFWQAQVLISYEEKKLLPLCVKKILWYVMEFGEIIEHAKTPDCFGRQGVLQCGQLGRLRWRLTRVTIADSVIDAIRFVCIALAGCPGYASIRGDTAPPPLAVVINVEFPFIFRHWTLLKGLP